MANTKRAPHASANALKFLKEDKKSKSENHTIFSIFGESMLGKGNEKEREDRESDCASLCHGNLKKQKIQLYENDEMIIWSD